VDQLTDYGTVKPSKHSCDSRTNCCKPDHAATRKCFRSVIRASATETLSSARCPNFSNPSRRSKWRQFGDQTVLNLVFWIMRSENAWEKLAADMGCDVYQNTFGKSGNSREEVGSALASRRTTAQPNHEDEAREDKRFSRQMKSTSCFVLTASYRRRNCCQSN
jgi:hypothetical protein